MFSHREYFSGSILFSQGTIPSSLIFIKYGRISLELRCSIIDIHNLIKFIFENIFLNPIYKRLSQNQKNRYMSNEKMINIKSYINDPTLMRLKTYNKEFIDEMNIIRTYTLTILTENELIGLEEIFLRMPYITKATVVNNKVECYELSLNNLDKLLGSGREVLLSYTKYTMNKISTLIERLQNIKKNYINMSLAKYEVKSNSSDNKPVKNLNINLNSENNVNEEIKNNGAKIYFNNPSQINSEIKTDNTEKRIESLTKNIIKFSSPIKLFMANLSPESQNRFNEMKKAFLKLRKNKLKLKSTYFNKSTKNPININNKTLFPKTSNNSKTFITNNQIKPKKKLFDINSKSSVVYNPDDIANNKNLIDNLIIESTSEKNRTSKINSENETTSLQNFNLKTRNKNVNNHTFNFNYIPLSIICQNAEQMKNKNPINNMNDILFI